ncbi:tetratricopeptide repeat protein [Myroides sp. LJL119]
MNIEDKGYALARLNADQSDFITLLLLQRRYFEALALCESQKNNVENLFNTGVSLYYLNRYEHALTSFQKALQVLNKQLPMTTSSLSVSLIEQYFHNKQLHEIQVFSMGGINKAYLEGFTDMTRLYLACNILLCMDKLEMWEEMQQLSGSLFSQHKLSFIQKLLQRYTSKIQEQED